jgi:hypothetical protein
MSDSFCESHDIVVRGCPSAAQVALHLQPKEDAMAKKATKKKKAAKKKAK